MNHTKIFKILLALFAAVLCFGQVGLSEPLGTAFTYQGRLTDANEAANGLYDFQFKLFDGEADGNRLGTDVNKSEVDVSDGYFIVELDFGGDVFDGNAVWLEVGVRPGDQNDPNVYTVLTPRQEITPTPYALYALGAGGGGGSLWQVNGTSIYYNSGNVGIGTTSPGAKLEVAGQVKITSGSPANGKVLTSDSSGLATWQNPPVETDPTVVASVKDGVAWVEVSGIPAGFADGVDDVGLTAETDPQVSSATTNSVPKWNGTTLVDSAVYDSNGNVGIGTSSPAAKLTVSNSAAPDGPTIGMSTSYSGSTNTFLEILKNDYDAGYTINQARKGLSITDNSTTWTISTNRNAGEWGQKLRFGTLATAENYTSGFNDCMVVQANGNVGIGTTNPDGKLDIYGAASPTTNLVLAANYENKFRWRMKTVDRDNGIDLDFTSSDAGDVEEAVLQLTRSNSTRPEFAVLTDDLVVNNGNVGIGTTSPTFKMEVSEGTDQKTQINGGWLELAHSGGSGFDWKNSASEDYDYRFMEAADGSYLSMGPGGGSLFLNSTGNVGIGTTSPAAKLEVNGYIKTAIIYETFMGNNWIPVESSRNWWSVAMSADGTKQTAVVDAGQIYVSTNSGNTWTPKESNRDWRSVAMSSDGTKQTAVAYGGRIYVSTDSGNTWTDRESNRNWLSVAMSADGTKQTAVVYGGQIYVSTDSGNSWTAKESNRNWFSVAMSSDGTKQTAVVNIGFIYVSTDSGNTWTYKVGPAQWVSVAMSADGKKQTAVFDGGYIYVSTDSGDTWTAKESGRWWASVAMSADGTKQTAVVDGGQIYVSTNSGNTWTPKESNRNWQSVAMSANGEKQTAVVYGGLIHISGGSGVGIGTTNPDGTLDVNGRIYQRGSLLHADYVFEPGYKLESIDEHSEFMWQEKHLPAMPKIQKDENGREIVEIGARSRGVVEELEKAHIYIEQLNKENKELRAKLTMLDARLDTMESQMDGLSLKQEGGIK